MIPCAICRKEFYVAPFEDGKKKYCSRPCMRLGSRLQGPGAKIRRRDGYIHVYYPSHPDSTQVGWMLEHRLVAEEKYGRRILKTEHVHHINGIRDDNRPENLEVIDPSRHATISTANGVRKRKKDRDELEEYRRRFGALTD